MNHLIGIRDINLEYWPVWVTEKLYHWDDPLSGAFKALIRINFACCAISANHLWEAGRFKNLSVYSVYTQGTA
jgi:hypothetical protein